MTFDEFCIQYTLTGDERRMLVEYLAFIRMRNTLSTKPGPLASTEALTTGGRN